MAMLFKAVKLASVLVFAAHVGITVQSVELVSVVKDALVATPYLPDQEQAALIHNASLLEEEYKKLTSDFLKSIWEKHVNLMVLSFAQDRSQQELARSVFDNAQGDFSPEELFVHWVDASRKCNLLVEEMLQSAEAESKKEGDNFPYVLISYLESLQRLVSIHHKIPEAYWHHIETGSQEVADLMEKSNAEIVDYLLPAATECVSKMLIPQAVVDYINEGSRSLYETEKKDEIDLVVS